MTMRIKVTNEDTLRIARVMTEDSAYSCTTETRKKNAGAVLLNPGESCEMHIHAGNILVVQEVH